MNRRNILKAIAMIALFGTLAASVIAANLPAPRQIYVVAKDMAFFVGDDPTPNPALILDRGEEVELVFVNRDRGMRHDVTIDDLGQATRLLPGDGSRTILRFRAPRVAGEHEYTCTLHEQMMRGRVVVR